MECVLRESVRANEWIRKSVSWDKQFGGAVKRITDERPEELHNPLVVNTTIVVNIAPEFGVRVRRLSSQSILLVRDFVSQFIPGQRGPLREGSFLDAENRAIVKLTTHLSQLVILVKGSFLDAVCAAIKFAARLCLVTIKSTSTHVIPRMVDHYFNDVRLVSFSASVSLCAGLWSPSASTMLARETEAVVRGTAVLVKRLCDAAGMTAWTTTNRREVVTHTYFPEYADVWHKRSEEIVDAMYHIQCDEIDCTCKSGREAARNNLRDSAVLRTCYRYLYMDTRADVGNLAKGQQTPAHITESGVVQMLGFTNARHMTNTLESIALCCRRHNASDALWEDIDLENTSYVWSLMPEMRIARSIYESRK